MIMAKAFGCKKKARLRRALNEIDGNSRQREIDAILRGRAVRYWSKPAPPTDETKRAVHRGSGGIGAGMDGRDHAYELRDSIPSRQDLLPSPLDAPGVERLTAPLLITRRAG